MILKGSTCATASQVHLLPLRSVMPTCHVLQTGMYAKEV